MFYMGFMLVLIIILILNGFISLIFLLKKLNTYNSIDDFLHPFTFKVIDEKVVKKRLASWLITLILLFYIFSIVVIIIFSYSFDCRL